MKAGIQIRRPAPAEGAHESYAVPVLELTERKGGLPSAGLRAFARMLWHVNPPKGGQSLARRRPTISNSSLLRRHDIHAILNLLKQALDLVLREERILEASLDELQHFPLAKAANEPRGEEVLIG